MCTRNDPDPTTDAQPGRATPADHICYLVFFFGFPEGDWNDRCVGVQVVAYLMISAMSAAAPVTDYMRQKADNLFTDSAAAAISMAFFAFVAIGLSALVSGYSLSMEVFV